MKRIVVGTDGSPRAMAALVWASKLALDLAAEIVLVHVFETDPNKFPGGFLLLTAKDLKSMRNQCEASLAAEWSIGARRVGVRWRPLLLDGNPAAVLIGLAERENADLIVVGNRGRGGLSELLFGGVGRHLVQRSQIPVTIVPIALAAGS